jgi:hypothetical protein
VDETGEGASKQTSLPLIGTPHESGKGPSNSSQRVTVETLSRKVREFCSSQLYFYFFPATSELCDYLLIFGRSLIFQISKHFFGHIQLLGLKNTRELTP